MDDEEIRVNWRAAIMPLEGKQVMYGRLSVVGKRRAVVRLDINLQAGYRCNLALLPPKRKPDETVQFIEGRGVVGTSVLAAPQFHVTVNWEEMKGSSESVLRERIGSYKEVWK